MLNNNLSPKTITMIYKHFHCNQYYSTDITNCLLKNEYKLGPFSPVKSDLIDLWGIDPFDNVNWLWRLHSLDMTSELLSAFLKTKNVEYLNCLESILTSWILNNSYEPYPSRFSWHDHASALRLNNIIKIILNVENNTSAHFINLLMLSGQQHCHFLVQDKYYSKHTNHGLDQSIALYFGSLIFFSETQSIAMTKLAKDRIKKELKFAFSSEGVHVENSPQYHGIMLTKILRLKKVFEFSDIDFHKELDDILSLGFEFLTHIINPLGFYPILGDSEKVVPAKVFYNLSINNKKYTNLLYALSEGKIGEKPINLNYVAKEAGYAIYRNSWSFSDSNIIQLIFKFGYKSNYHRHDDDLNILLNAYNEEWLIDSGLYSYNDNDTIRQYMRSAQAHNVPTPNTGKALRNIKLTGNTSTIKQCKINNNNFMIEVSSGIYENCIINRELNITNERITISDEIIDPSSEINTLITYFHIPADKQIIKQNNQTVLIKSNLTNRTMVLKIINNSSMQIDITRGEHNVTPSFTSTKYGEIEDSQCISVKANKLHASFELTFL